MFFDDYCEILSPTNEVRTSKSTKLKTNTASSDKAYKLEPLTDKRKLKPNLEDDKVSRKEIIDLLYVIYFLIFNKTIIN